jgi:hypothetical protein
MTLSLSVHYIFCYNKVTTKLVLSSFQIVYKSFWHFKVPIFFYVCRYTLTIMKLDLSKRHIIWDEGSSVLFALRYPTLSGNRMSLRALSVL